MLTALGVDPVASAILPRRLAPPRPRRTTSTVRLPRREATRGMRLAGSAAPRAAAGS
ncbi:hypothetical protein ACRAWF_20950 [Streptomyces sp. L7]